MSSRPEDQDPSVQSLRRGELCVFVTCHSLVLALPVRTIRRLVLDEDVELTPFSRQDAIAMDSVPAFIGVARVGAERYAGWDLSAMLELPPLEKSWILINLARPDRDFALALRTGDCRAVRALSAVTPMPPGIFRSRTFAMAGAFSAPSVQGQTGSMVGLYIDPVHLWNPSELEFSRFALAAPSERRRPHVR